MDIDRYEAEVRLNAAKTTWVRADYFDDQNRFKPENYARDLVHHSPERYLTEFDNDRVFYYKDGMYHDGGEKMIADLSATLFKNTLTPQMLTRTMLHVKSQSRVRLTDFNQHDTLIPLNNGVYDIKRDRMLPHDWQYKWTFKIPTNYNPQAQCPIFLKFIEQILRPEDVAAIQEMFGYALTADQKYQKAFMLLGSGANGKSTLLEVLVNMLGEDNTVSIPLQDLTMNRFKLANLFGKRANIVMDAPDSKLSGSNIFKTITSDDWVDGELKGIQKQVRFRSGCKQIFAANSLPENEDWSYAFTRRWIWIKFLQTFTEKERDLTLPTRLKSTTELQGVLLWSIKGLHRLEQQTRFTTTISGAEIEDEWIRAKDPVKAFCMDCITQSSDPVEIPKDQAYEAYSTYSFARGYDVMERSRFHEALRQKAGFSLKITQPRIGDQRQRCYSNIHIDYSILSDVPESGTGRLENGTGIVVPENTREQETVEREKNAGTTGTTENRNQSVKGVELWSEKSVVPLVPTRELSVKIAHDNLCQNPCQPVPKQDGTTDTSISEVNARITELWHNVMYKDTVERDDFIEECNKHAISDSLANEWLVNRLMAGEIYEIKPGKFADIGGNHG